MKEVLDPFKKAIAYLVVNGVEEEYKGEGRVVAFAANGIYEQTESIIVNMIDEITESNLNEKDKDDCFLMLEGLAAALDTRDILMIRSSCRSSQIQSLARRTGLILKDALRLSTLMSTDMSL